MTLYIGIDLSTDPANTGIAALCLDKARTPKHFAVSHVSRNPIWCGNVTQWSKHLKDTEENWPNHLNTFAERATLIAKIVKKIESLFYKTKNPSKKIIVAIDVPFGWPNTFKQALINHTVGAGINAESDDFCFRRSELLIRERSERILDPLSVSTDKLGRTALLGSKILNILSRSDFVFNHVEKANEKKIIIEVYPSATAFALSTESTKRNFTLRNFYNSKFKKPIGMTARIDKYDAIVAAYTAFLFDNYPVFFEMPNKKDHSIINDEGWIWFPRELKSDERRIHRDRIFRLLERARNGL